MTTPTTSPSPLSPEHLLPLALAAITAKSHAYCPYSEFRVGASILIADKTIWTGSNVEVASTPVGICAERCALAPLVASLKRPAMPDIKAIAVATDAWPPSSPCGMCRYVILHYETKPSFAGIVDTCVVIRQMIREFSKVDTPIYMYGRQPLEDGATYPADMTPEEELEICGKPLMRTIGELLPLSFGPDDLKRGDGKDR